MRGRVGVGGNARMDGRRHLDAACIGQRSMTPRRLLPYGLVLLADIVVPRCRAGAFEADLARLRG